MFELLLATSGKIKPVELVQYIGYEKIADLDIPLHGSIPYIWNDKLFVKGGGTDVSSSDPGLRRFKLDGTFENNKNLSNYIYHTNPAQDSRTGRVYLINGRSNGSWSSSVVHAIDASAETITNLGWSTPRGNYGNSTVFDEDNNRIYVQFHDSNQFGYYTTDGVYHNSPKGFPAASLSGSFIFKHKGYIYVMGGWGSSVASNPDHLAKFDAGTAMTTIMRMSIYTQLWEVYDILPTEYHGGNQGAGNYHEGIFSYISWSGSKLGAVRYDVSGKRFIRFDTGISYRNATGVVGNKGELYLVGGCSIPLGSTNPPFGRKAETKTEIYKFILPAPLPPSDK